MDFWRIDMCNIDYIAFKTEIALHVTALRHLTVFFFFYFKFNFQCYI